MSDFSQRLEEAVNIDDEIFFGPVTDKEKKVREHFENFVSSNKTSFESLHVAENEISTNDSLYKSFPAEDSKYDSFEDSLNEAAEDKPQAAKHVTLRKSFDKLKAKKHAFYDSLEDVCSLVSNMDKCSMSCDIEKDSNFVEKQHIFEDSLKVPPVVVINKSNGASEQIHFEDDSLAIAEFENTFDDSLEEINMISSIESIEIEEICDIENVDAENVIVTSNVDQKPILVSRNLFDTSVDIIYEKKNFIKADPDESYNSKNKLFDSLSNSECKDAFKDSLEESENGIVKLHSLKSESNVPIIEPERSGEKNELDMSVQIVYENIKNSSYTENISNSECNDVSKDSLENLKHINSFSLEQPQTSYMDSSNILELFLPKSEKINIEKNMLDESVQILYEKRKNSSCRKAVSISKHDYVIKDNLETLKNISSCSTERPVVSSSHVVNSKKCRSSSKNIALLNQSIEKDPTASRNDLEDLSKNVTQCNFESNKACKELKDNSVTADDIPTSIVDNSDSRKETITIDACQLTFLNDNFNLDKDLKLQLQIEVTVGDKKCKIEPENIKIIPVLNSKECKKVSSPSDSVKFYNRNVEKNDSPILDDGSKTKLCQEQNEKEDILVCDVVPDENILCKANITHRIKESLSRSFNDSKEEHTKGESSLLQALDLHDVSLFFNESIIQSNDTLMPLNLCSEDQVVHKPQSSVLRDESKENFPELSVSCYNHKQDSYSSHGKASPYKINENKTPMSLKDGPSSKENLAKRTGGTRIPVRKMDKFAFPTSSAHTIKQTPVSAEKEKRCVHSPHLTDSGKKIPGVTPHSAHHYCKVRNTIFSKVPQIVPCKKYMNVQSPVAQYIRNAQGYASVKTPVLEPVLRDCMNDIRFHQQLESPYHPHTLPKGSSSKLTNKKA